MSDEVSLLPVIVGGAIGVAGPVALLWFQTKSDKKKARAAKFEELVSSIYDTDHWLDRQESYRVYGTAPEPTETSPVGKAKTIATVYFTRLRTDVETFADAARNQEMWQLEMATKRLANPLTFVTEGHTEAYTQYLLRARRAAQEIVGIRSARISVTGKAHARGTVTATIATAPACAEPDAALSVPRSRGMQSRPCEV
jgi:hypothetical protein